MTTLALFIGIPAAVCGLFLIVLYNGLISRKNSVENAFGAIDAQLKKRYDLIPNLISAVKTYMEHEQGLLTQLTELRTRAVSGALPEAERVRLEGDLSNALRGVMVAVENYPNLKANENFVQLQNTLYEVEAHIAAARRAYNGAVTEYNNGIEMFPSNLLAGFMRMSRKSVFEAQEVERQNVNVRELFKKAS